MKKQTNFQFLSKEGTPPIDTHDELQMVREGIRPSARRIIPIPKKTKEERQKFRKLAQQHLLENKVMLKYSC